MKKAGGTKFSIRPKPQKPCDYVPKWVTNERSAGVYHLYDEPVRVTTKRSRT